MRGREAAAETQRQQVGRRLIYSLTCARACGELRAVSRNCIWSQNHILLLKCEDSMMCLHRCGSPPLLQHTGPGEVAVNKVLSAVTEYHQLQTDTCGSLRQ
ncbi:hypothetical protein AV530_011356 [Patagioenas fasciata monilis]|uniref:Uncharacterized protein n=1 Tax=Patagioenas fasciata monilis TaxID=372326 RepID=A0A1V4KP49_PATFA|nr:hypothetical protein AV530_011356 [Patagioenas fasciata monilis]